VSVSIAQQPASGNEEDKAEGNCALTISGEMIKLWNGVLMPRVGFGTAGMRGIATENAVSTALKMGFRHFDGAESKEWYDDEALGRTIKNSGIAREEIFITTKVNPRNYGKTKTKIAIANILSELQTDYIDLMLLHFPECWSGIPSCNGDDVEIEGNWLDAYKVLEKEYERGNIRAIGVSNFHYDLLKDALKKVKIRPHVVQNWMDPFHQDTQVRELCTQNDIVYTAYSSLGGQWGKQKNPVLHDAVISEIAKKHAISNVDVVLRWSLTKNVVILPRSSNPVHIKNNAALINLLRETQGSCDDNQNSNVHNLDLLDDSEIERIDNLTPLQR